MGDEDSDPFQTGQSDFSNKKDESSVSFVDDTEDTGVAGYTREKEDKKQEKPGIESFPDVPWKYWPRFMGDCLIVKRIIDDKELMSRWFLPIVLNSVLRCFGNVFFCNNPLTGGVILSGVTFLNPLVSFGCILGALVGLAVSLVIGHERQMWGDGISLINPLLVGGITLALFPTGHSIGDSLELFTDYRVTLGLVVGCTASVYIGRGLDNVLGSCKVPLFGMSLPFNFVTLPLIKWMAALPSSDDSPIKRYQDNVEESWEMIVLGVFKGSGQVFLVDSVAVSMVVFLATAVCSPYTAVFAFLGSLVASITGYQLLTNENESAEEVYVGFYGFNGLLTSAAIGGFFFTPSWHSTFLAIMGAFCSTILHYTLAKAKFPVFSFPFNIITLLMLAISAPGLYRIPIEELAYPELHYRRRIWEGKKPFWTLFSKK